MFAGRVHSLLSGLDLRSAIDISLCEAVLPSLSGLGSAVRIASLPVSVSAASPPDGLYQLTSSMNALVQQQLSGRPFLLLPTAVETPSSCVLLIQV